MDFAKIKKYPNQISTAFKRFPLASLFAVFSTIAFLIVCESFNIPSEQSARFILWLAIYPIAAMFIALDTSLVQEALKNRNPKIQAITGIAWFVISWLIVLYPNTLNDYEMSQTIGALVFIYTTIFLGLFVAPFFKQKNENAFWVHLTKTVKSLVVATIVAGLLLFAMELLFLGFFGLFGFTDPSERPFLYIFIFCTSTVLPLLFFSTLPTIDECLETTPTSSKFVTSICQFLFIPVLAVSIALFYCYILKFFIIQDIPYEVIIWLVVTFMVFMLALNIVMYPSRLNPNPTLEKKVLKIFPIAIFPLVLLMTLSIFQLMSDEIDELIIYLIATNIFFYIAIAILLIKKIECKSKYMAIAFCAILLVVCVGPLSASNIVRHIWIDSVKSTLIEEGFSDFPLSQDNIDSLCDKLAKKDFPKAARFMNRLEALVKGQDKEIAKYIDASYTIRIPDKNENSATEYEIDTEIDHSDTEIFDVPKGTAKFYRLTRTFYEEEFEYRNDTLFFKVSPYDDKTFHFSVTKQALENSATTFIEGQDAQIQLQELRVSIGTDGENKFKKLWIEGYIFMK
jgi:hypothetical protein